MTAVEFAVLLNSALYLGGCIAAGLATGNPVAWKLALANAALLYLGYLAQFMHLQVGSLATAAWLFGTIVLGAGAGVALLIVR